MKEWTDAELEAQGYYPAQDPDSPEPRNQADRNHYKQAAHRESLLPCSGSYGQPLADKEPVTPLTEVQRLFPDQERVRGILAARKAAGI